SGTQIMSICTAACSIGNCAPAGHRELTTWANHIPNMCPMGGKKGVQNLVEMITKLSVPHRVWHVPCNSLLCLHDSRQYDGDAYMTHSFTSTQPGALAEFGEGR